MRHILFAIGCGITMLSACSFESPEVPDSDFVLEGTYLFQSADNSDLAGILEGAVFEFHTDGSFEFTNPGWTNEEHESFDIVESGMYGFQEVEENSGFFAVDVISQVPPQLASFYTFQGGLNRIRFELETGTTAEVLNVYLPYSEKRYWAAFAKQIPVRLEGTYSFESSADETLGGLLSGAELSFGDGMFELDNPVTVEILHADTTIMIIERGPFSTTIDSIVFELYSQEPEGADSLFVLTPPSVTAALLLEDGTLTITFPGEGRDGATYWSAPSAIEEIEPNDTRDEATVLSGSGTFSISGELITGGIDTEGDYSGDYDYFSLVPASEGTFTATLTWSVVADLDIFLVDRAGTALAYSSMAGQTGPESMEYTVAEGEDYFILVVSADNPASYSATIKVP